MAFGERLKKTAGRLIERFGEGRTVTLKHVTGWAADPVTRIRTATAFTSYGPLPAVLSEFTEEEIARSQTRTEQSRRIQERDKKFIVEDPPAGLPEEPDTEEWKFTDNVDGLSYNVVYSKPKQPGLITIYREVQVRR